MTGIFGGGGSGGIPGGSNTQIQYNNSGAFGGITGATTNGTALTLVAPVLGAATGTSLALGGAIIGTDALAVTGTSTLGGAVLNSGAFTNTSGGIQVGSSAINYGFSAAATSVGMRSDSVLTWYNGANINGGTADVFVGRQGAASLRLGNIDVDTAPVAQTLRTQGALAGGTSNVAGANWTFIASPGKGTGIGGSFIFQTTPAGSTGTVVGTPTTALTLDSTQKATFAGALSSVGSHTFTAATAGIILKQGSNGLCGTFVSNGVTPVTVSNTNVAITDCIIISLNTVGGTVGASAPDVKTITAGTGFTVAGVSLDTSTYNYAIIKNAA